MKVKVSFEGKYSDGPNAGQLIRGTKADFFELELQVSADPVDSSGVKSGTVKTYKPSGCFCQYLCRATKGKFRFCPPKIMHPSKTFPASFQVHHRG